MTDNNRSNRKKGLTMVEMLVTVALMGIVGVVVMGFLTTGARQVIVVDQVGDYASAEARTQLALLKIVEAGRDGAFEVRTTNYVPGSSHWNMEYPRGSGDFYAAFARAGSGMPWVPLREFDVKGPAEVQFLRLDAFGNLDIYNTNALPAEAFFLNMEPGMSDSYAMWLDCGEEPTSISITVVAPAGPMDPGYTRESSVAVHRIPSAPPWAGGFPPPAPSDGPTPTLTPEPTPDPNRCVTVFTGDNIWFPTGSIVFHEGQYYLVLQGDRCGFQFNNPTWVPGGPGLGAVWHHLADWTPEEWPNCKTRDELLAMFPPGGMDDGCGEVSPQPDGMCRFCSTATGTWSWQPGAMVHGANCQAFPSQSCP